jgi:hypothetical protein
VLKSVEKLLKGVEKLLNPHHSSKLQKMTFLPVTCEKVLKGVEKLLKKC